MKTTTELVIELLNKIDNGDTSYGPNERELILFDANEIDDYISELIERVEDKDKIIADLRIELMREREADND